MQNFFLKSSFVLGLVLFNCFLTNPTSAFAQSSGESVVRIVCFDRTEITNGQTTGGWAVVITQVSSEDYAADIFIPDDNGDYANKFPMFEDTAFFVSVFEDTSGTIGREDLSLFAEALLQDNNAPASIPSEGNRVGTFLDIGWTGSGNFQYDSKDPSKNLFVDSELTKKRMPACEKPFIHTPAGT